MSKRANLTTEEKVNRMNAIFPVADSAPDKHSPHLQKMKAKQKSPKNPSSTASSTGGSSGAKKRKSALGKTSRHWTEVEMRNVENPAVMHEIFGAVTREARDAAMLKYFPLRTLDAVRCKAWRGTPGYTGKK